MSTAPDANRPLPAEAARMAQAGRPDHGVEETGPWYVWGPYLSERAWGTVREDYSDDGDAWRYFPYEHSTSRTYRWNEDGLAGLSDLRQDVCLSLALWNGRDSHLKERLFGLTGHQGNHGEDLKEYVWFLDGTPSHSWLSWRYHYPQVAFPYADLVAENARRGRLDPEYELLDTGAFDDDRYWVVNVDYAKDDPTDVCMRIRVTNAGPEADTLHVLPTLWFRNTWSQGHVHSTPVVRYDDDTIIADHERAGLYHFEAGVGSDGSVPTPLFCDNVTHETAVWGPSATDTTPYPKDGINDHVVHGRATVNPELEGTKASWWYQVTVEPGRTVELRLRLWSPVTSSRPQQDWSGTDFDQVMTDRLAEADEFYAAIAPEGATEHERAVMRQAFAGMIWSKQFYRYDVGPWLDGDPGEPAPPPGHKAVRNGGWRHLDAADIISMPDPWEYPWFAAWDLAFHTVVFAHIDPAFAKAQLILMLREWYMHPNGAIPAYEWSFDDLNPPVHAWAALRVYEIDGARDHEFLARIFHKLLINFTWWVNRVDAEGNNVFEGGFLGLDNIGPIDRSHLPPGYELEQADGTAWMAFYCLMMVRIALRLSAHDPSYGGVLTKFLEHFVSICDGMSAVDMWDPNDGFFYDQLVSPDGDRTAIRARSLVGVIPVLAAAYLSGEIDSIPGADRVQRRWLNFLKHRGNEVDGSARDKAGFALVTGEGTSRAMLLTVVDPDRLRRVLMEVLSEDSMLSPYGVRSLSKRHLHEPVSIDVRGTTFQVDYEPAESTTALYGGNSNWRGPVWFPINHLVIEALERYDMYLGDGFRVECPTGSGTMLTLGQVAQELRRRLISLFLPDDEGRRPVFGGSERFQSDPRWNDAVFFNEYFNGDDGAGLGAAHQTGWTGLVADLIVGRKG